MSRLENRRRILDTLKGREFRVEWILMEVEEALEMLENSANNKAIVS